MKRKSYVLFYTTKKVAATLLTNQLNIKNTFGQTKKNLYLATQQKLFL